MHEVLPQLFVGESTDALRLDLSNVGLVVCACRDHPMPFKSTVKYAYYPLIDDETDNVLLYVDDCFEQISTILNDEDSRSVLVHCQHGVSRSVALITAYLMKRFRITFEDAYKEVSQKYPQARIANNFASQLTLYGTKLMWNTSGNTQAHRLYRATAGIILDSPVESNLQPKYRYTCRKCRECLFSDLHVIPSSISNYRVECMQWMNFVDASGPIICPRCSSKLGEFNWAGLYGEYDFPGFIITKSKVDEMLAGPHTFPKSRF